MSGAFFFEHIVEAMINLEEQSKLKNVEIKAPNANLVKKPRKK